MDSEEVKERGYSCDPYCKAHESEMRLSRKIQNRQLYERFLDKIKINIIFNSQKDGVSSSTIRQ